ncbi:MAG: hypothetical protein CL583_04890 [Alteromonadaceae bacterium]|nr:hypothetical protein [Alteromonadaceae bacterium]
MSSFCLIEIVSVAGEGFAFGPAGAEGAGQPFSQRGADTWRAWLHQTFAHKFAEQAGQWEQVLASVEPVTPALAPHITFKRVASLIDSGKLQVRRLPVATPPTTTAVAGQPSSAMRSREPDMGQAAPPAPSATASRGVSSASVGQDAAGMQLKGDPVAPVSGEEILTLEDFTVAAPMPLRWQRWYRSGYCDRDLGLGAGWFAECLRLIWQDADATWLIDSEARPVRLALLARGEIAWHAIGGQRLERKHDDRMLLTERDGRVWIFAPDGADAWRPTSVQNTLGHQWLLFYDAQRRLTRLELAPGKSLEFGYVSGHRLNSVTLQQDSHSQNLVTYGYDQPHGNLAAATTANGTERYGYQGSLITSRRLTTGYHFFFHWEGLGPDARCVRTHGEDGSYDFRFAYQPDKFQTCVTDAFGAEQVFHYDEQGRITARQDPDGGTHQWQYNARGQLSAYRLPDGRTTSYSFDPYGRPTLERLPDGREHHRQYNALGFCVGEQLPDGKIIKRRFDALGRLLGEQRADGRIWQYHYDEKGWLSEACSDTGEVLRTGFNRDGQLMAAEIGSNLNRYAFDAQGRVQGHLIRDLVTEYDYQDDQVSAVHQYPEQAPQLRQSRFYKYDSAGRLTRFTSATGAVHAYEYQGLARPVRYQRPDGKSVFYQYDKAERLTDVIRPDGGRWQLRYNSKGQVSACRAPDGRHVQFSYDAAGDIVHREQPGDWVQHLKRDAGGRVLQQSSQGRDRAPVTRQFQYDSFGRRQTATCADRRLSWCYDARGQISEHQQDQHSVQYQYGPGQRLEQIRLPDGTEIRYHYDRLGRWHRVDINGQNQLQRQFDDQGRETLREAGANRQTQVWDRHDRLINRRWQAQETCVRRYSWDAESRLEHYEDSREGKHQFQRDAQGQLIAENDQPFSYDDGGNRIEQAAQIQQDRLIQQGAAKRRYDALGAETEVHGPKTQRRRFDAEGQLIEVTGDGLHVQYGYDALGRRAWRKSVEGVVTYLWHNDVLLGEQRDGQWQWYIRDPQTDAPLLTLINGETHYYELDWRQAPVRLWNERGGQTWQGNADAWGKYRLRSEISQSIRLPGQFEDELTQLHFNRFRDYDPSIGRYLSPDPVGLEGGVNSYRYTPNPIDFIDSLGLSCTSTNRVNSLLAAALALGISSATNSETAAPTLSELPKPPSLAGALADKEFWLGYGEGVKNVGLAAGKMILGELSVYSGWILSKIPGGGLTGTYLMVDGASIYAGGMSDVSNYFYGESVNYDFVGNAYRNAGDFYFDNEAYGDVARSSVGISAIFRANTIPVTTVFNESDWGVSALTYTAKVPAYYTSNTVLKAADAVGIVDGARTVADGSTPDNDE